MGIQLRIFFFPAKNLNWSFGLDQRVELCGHVMSGVNSED